MYKKIVRICLVLVIGLGAIGMNCDVFLAVDKVPIETSPNSYPKTTAGDDDILSVEETAEWTNTDITKGEVNVKIKSAVGEGEELLKNQDIIFVSDISGSMTGERIKQMKIALKQSATAFLDPDLNNKIALASFDDRVSVDYQLGNEITAFNNAVDNIANVGKGGGGTNYEVGLKQAYDIIKNRDEKGRTPVVIFMTDGNPTSFDGIDMYQKKIKEFGATIYTIQYMNGSAITQILLEIATSSEYAYNAIKTSYITDIYNSIVNRVISSKSYKDIVTKFEIRNANFSLEDVKVDVGTVKKSGNEITWTIPSLLSGAAVNLTAKVNLLDTDASGFLWTHKPGSVSYGVTGKDNVTNLTLNSTTLDRVMYNVLFDSNGATSGDTPDDYKAAGDSMINVPSNPKGLGKTGEVFLGWSISGKDGLITGKKQMPNSDLTLKAEWGKPTISMNTDTIYSEITHIDKTKFNSLASSVGTTVTSIEFVNTIDASATNTYDLEVTGEESIKAWVTANKLYIGSKGKITAPVICDNLFTPFKTVENIVFNGYFDTSEVTSMQGMFSGYNNLSSIDISTFDTSKVVNMSNMFLNQMDLKNLTLGNIDTSNVEDMSSMFRNVGLLQIVATFNTTKVKNMGKMFADCSPCSEFDLSTFTWTAALNNNGLTDMFTNSNNTGNKKVWVQSEAIMNSLSYIAMMGNWPTLGVKSTSRSNINKSSTKKVKSNTKAIALASTDGLVNGGKIGFGESINYKILVGFESRTASKSGVMKVTNIIPSDLTFDTSIPLKIGSAVWDNSSGSTTAPTGRIYDAKVENNVLTFYVKDLSTNAKIDLSYTAKAPTAITSNYKEILNQSSLTVENVNVTSNYVRHFLGSDDVLPPTYKLAYAYDGVVPGNVPILPEVREYAEGQEINVPSMSMPGYFFNGWKNGSTDVNSGIMTMPASNTELVGSWTKISTANELKGSVSYEYIGDVPDGLDAPVAENYIVGSRKDGIDYISKKTITIPTAPSAEGYEFEGWKSTTINDDEISSGSFQLGHEDVVLTGKWAKKKYHVTYKYADGITVPAGVPSLPSSQTVTWGEHVTTENKMTDINGFSFDGWYSDSNIDPDFQTGFEMPKEDVELYAYWTKKPYNITYQYKGDIPTDAITLGTSSNIDGVPVTVWEVSESKETVKDGVVGTWKFNGFKSNEVTIVDGKFTMPTKNVTLEGTWTFTKNPNIRTITFIIENGRWNNLTNTPINFNIELINGVATLPSNKVPTGMIASDGFTDGHWIVVPNTSVGGITGDVTYTYKFVKKPIVTFKVENGTWIDGKNNDKKIALEMISGKATLLSSDVPKGMRANNGYSEGYWVVTPNTIVNGIIGDVTYTYKFIKKPIVTFKIENGTWNDGKSNNKQVILETVSGKATLLSSDVPKGMHAKDGYTNGHWVLEPNLEVNGITQDVTYIYTYSKSKYDIVIKDESGDIKEEIKDIEHGKNVIIKDQDGNVIDKIEINNDTKNIILPSLNDKIIKDINITFDAEGNVIIQVDYADKNENNPIMTNDATHIIGMIALLTMSFMVISFVSKKKKRNSNI